MESKREFGFQNLFETRKGDFITAKKESCDMNSSLIRLLSLSPAMIFTDILLLRHTIYSHPLPIISMRFIDRVPLGLEQGALSLRVYPPHF